MSEPTLQIVALVGHGNLFLSEPADTRAPELLGVSSAFKYVETVTFSRRASWSDGQGRLVASGTAAWFSLLRHEKASRLRFVAPGSNGAERTVAGFANSVSMAIQVTYPSGFEIWRPHWDFTPGSNWSVRYRSNTSRRSVAVPQTDLNEVKDSLRQAVADAEAFARRLEVGEEHWAGCFANALVQMDSQSPQGAYYANVLPEVGYSLSARQILAACQYADVFGAMGSWNEMGFNEKRLQNEYEQISAQLYSAVKIGYITVANSFEFGQ